MARRAVLALLLAVGVACTGTPPAATPIATGIPSPAAASARPPSPRATPPEPLPSSEVEPVFADCASRSFPEPETGLRTTLHLERGLLDISYDALGMKIAAAVEYLDPACHTARGIGELVDAAVRGSLANGGCDDFLQLLESGTVGYDGVPLDPEAVPSYYGLWCRAINEAPGEWREMPESPIRAGDDATAAWTGEELLVWGTDGLADGAAYDPESDTWRPLPDGPPGPAPYMAAFWIGDAVLAWHGGPRSSPSQPDGGLFDPATNEWIPISPGPLRSDYAQGVAWTGSELLVLATDMRAAAYNPATDTWRHLPNAPLPPGGIEADWTGTVWLVLGFGEDPDAAAEVATFDPLTDTWTKRAASPMTEQDLGRGAVWTPYGWLWMGWESFAYDFVADRWIVNASYCPIETGSAVWTGEVVFGLSTTFDPETGACATLPTAPESLRRSTISSRVWTGRELLLWGTHSGTGDRTTTDGAVFTPAESTFQLR